MINAANVFSRGHTPAHKGQFIEKGDREKMSAEMSTGGLQGAEMLASP